MPQDNIATLLELGLKTPRKHFRRGLDRGSIEATAKVGRSPFRMPTEDGSVAVVIFWMIARAGWREKHEVHISEKPLDHLTDAGLQTIVRGYKHRRIERETSDG